MISNFSVNRRNPGHWDIYVDRDRAFCIRGGPGNYYVRDEREGKQQNMAPRMKTVGACMTWICDELMHELIVAEGQTPTTIESWNV
jgi:hypothetical protein